MVLLCYIGYKQGAVAPIIKNEHGAGDPLFLFQNSSFHIANNQYENFQKKSQYRFYFSEITLRLKLKAIS